ncbi:alpha,alpha-trehalose-phosphate synthase (UDP-forming) [Microvirga sp. VF16]|uniref:alpha,alpha-trehalose-phosphate synthase (UDP-forming) n=1 Tax=Microvirga sp. VF16 TaxID=2807101 RepID=UPI00193E78C2|nr:alpha,alpha-trehalose-phosphate synthase (UDP-forming) [Microvirga sp. VF16]QRM34147.1 alpha,alpha-trehalose-phosphate synthase (UDP-forming) [Microvirga sp. VF16]
MPRLVVVSNRVAIPDASGKSSAGGLAVALREAFQRQEGLWFGWSGKVSAHPSTEPKMTDKGHVRYALMDLTATDRQEYYSGFANRALWPVMHYRIGLSEFSRADYAGYLRVNRTFARALARLIQADDLIWVHDYHLIPLAAELRVLGLANRIGYFHHIPWPAPEVIGTLPGSQDLLRAITEYDLVGVQTERDADNLRRGIIQEFDATQRTADVIVLGGRQTRVKDFPIAIDVSSFEQAACRPARHRLIQQTVASLGSRSLIIGIDRLDYSKGIPERMESFERFLISNPDQRGRVTYLQIAPTSRSEVPEYASLSRTVSETLGRINGAHGEPGWVPIHYVTSAYPRGVLAGLYRIARVGLVTPMRDGMNLVAKEYVAAQDPEDPGVLVLSKFAGAAEQLGGALIVNPNDKFEVAEAISVALHMERSERIARWRRMMDVLRRYDISWWTDAFLTELASQRKASKTRSPAPV